MDLEDLVDNFSKLVLNTDPNTKINLKHTEELDKIIESISQIKISDDENNNEISKDEIKNDIIESNKDEINLRDLLKSIFMAMLKRYGKSCGIETKKDEFIPDYLY